MRIVKGQTNKISLTLTEKCQEDDSEFILKLVNDFTKQEKVVALTDVSDYPDRSNIFNIEENETENLSHGVVSLSPTGQWTYTAYEMEVSSPRNLDPDNAIKIVETGRCLVYLGSEHTVNVFDEDNNPESPSFSE